MKNRRIECEVWSRYQVHEPYAKPAGRTYSVEAAIKLRDRLNSMPKIHGEPYVIYRRTTDGSMFVPIEAWTSAL